MTHPDTSLAIILYQANAGVKCLPDPGTIPLVKF